MYGYCVKYGSNDQKASKNIIITVFCCYCSVSLSIPLITQDAFGDRVIFLVVFIFSSGSRVVFEFVSRGLNMAELEREVTQP